MIDYTFRQLKPVNFKRTKKQGILAFKLNDDYMEGYAETDREGIDIIVPMLRLLKNAPARVRETVTIHPVTLAWYFGKQKIRNVSELENYINSLGRKQ